MYKWSHHSKYFSSWNLGCLLECIFQCRWPEHRLRRHHFPVWLSCATNRRLPFVVRTLSFIAYLLLLIEFYCLLLYCYCIWQSRELAFITVNLHQHNLTDKVVFGSRSRCVHLKIWLCRMNYSMLVMWQKMCEMSFQIDWREWFSW